MWLLLSLFTYWSRAHNESYFDNEYFPNYCMTYLCVHSLYTVYTCLARKHTGKVGPRSAHRSPPSGTSNGQRSPKPETSQSSIADNDTASSSFTTKSESVDNTSPSEKDEPKTVEISADSSAASSGGDRGPNMDDKATPTSTVATPTSTVDTDGKTDQDVAKSQPKVHPFFGMHECSEM